VRSASRSWRRTRSATPDTTPPPAFHRVSANVGDPDDLPTEDWVAKRDRLEGLLNLDTPILRNPLTVISVLTPLATSLLAAFLP